jgi:hypothetical protein
VSYKYFSVHEYVKIDSFPCFISTRCNLQITNPSQTIKQTTSNIRILYSAKLYTNSMPRIRYMGRFDLEPVKEAQNTLLHKVEKNRRALFEQPL